MGFLNSGEVHSPFLFFIRHVPVPSDRDILDELGFGAYEALEPDDAEHRPHLVIGHTTEWTVVADDYYYTLWHSEKKTHAIESHASRLDEAFICRWPDVDETFAFSVWEQGVCLRSFDLVSTGLTTPAVREESGVPLSIETNELASLSAVDRLTAISRELGYDARNAVGTFRVYGGPPHVVDIGPYELAITNISREVWDRSRKAGGSL